MDNHNQEDSTIVASYLRTTEKSISAHLIRESHFDINNISEELIAEVMSKERIKVLGNSAPKSMKDNMINLLNVIEARLKAKYCSS